MPRPLVGAKRHRYMTDEDRFWADVDRRGDDECWPWTGCRTATGYGRVRFGGKTMGTHRASYLIHHSSIPESLHILHRCDNPPCCNPAHLFVGTPVDNVADMDAKGRRRSCLGEDHGRSTLTADQVMEIWRSSERGSDIAVRYGITSGHVSDIRNGESWTHVTGGPADYKRLLARSPIQTRPEKVAEIQQLRRSGKSYGEIASAAGVKKWIAQKYGRLA